MIYARNQQRYDIPTKIVFIDKKISDYLIQILNNKKNKPETNLLFRYVIFVLNHRFIYILYLQSYNANSLIHITGTDYPPKCYVKISNENDLKKSFIPLCKLSVYIHAFELIYAKQINPLKAMHSPKRRFD